MFLQLREMYGYSCTNIKDIHPKTSMLGVRKIVGIILIYFMPGSEQQTP